MKLALLSAVLIAVVFTANCRDISDGQQPVAKILTTEEQLPGNHEFTAKDQYLQNGQENMKGQMGVELRGKLKKEGKKDKKVLRKLVDKLESLDNKLKSMMENITNGDLKLKKDLQTIQEHQFNITNTNTNIKKNLQTLKKNQDNMTESNKDFIKDLQIIKENQNNITNSNTDLKIDLQTLKEHQNNITDGNKDLKDELESIKTDMSSMKQTMSNVNSGNSQIKTDMSSMKQTLSNVNSGNSQLKTDMSSMKQTLANMNSSILSKLDSILPKQTNSSITAAPTTTTPGSTSSSHLKWLTVGADRFIKYNNTMNWTDARAVCRKDGLDLYEPKNASAVSKYLEVNYFNTGRSTFFWLGGRGNTTHQVWISGNVVPKTAPWWSDYGSSSYKTTNHCMFLFAYGGNGDKKTVLGAYNCRDTRQVLPLCG